jgi:hypothetical protein
MQGSNTRLGAVVPVIHSAALRQPRDAMRRPRFHIVLWARFALDAPLEAPVRAARVQAMLSGMPEVGSPCTRHIRRICLMSESSTNVAVGHGFLRQCVVR